MTIGAVVHSVVDQEASTPQFKKDGGTTKTKKSMRLNRKKENFKKFFNVWAC